MAIHGVEALFLVAQQALFAVGRVLGCAAIYWKQMTLFAILRRKITLFALKATTIEHGIPVEAVLWDIEVFRALFVPFLEIPVFASCAKNLPLEQIGKFTVNTLEFEAVSFILAKVVASYTLAASARVCWIVRVGLITVRYLKLPIAGACPCFPGRR